MTEKFLKINVRSTRANKKRKILALDRVKLPTRKSLIAKIPTVQVVRGELLCHVMEIARLFGLGIS